MSARLALTLLLGCTPHRNTADPAETVAATTQPPAPPVAGPGPAPASLPSAAPASTGGVLTGGPCEASALVRWEGGFLVGDNETSDRLFRYSDTFEPTGTLALPEEVSDIEALAVGEGGELFVVGSHSRNKAGEEKKKRQRVLRLPDTLLSPDLSACHACAGVSGLRPDDGGLNIEGAFVRDGHLWVGLRSPLVEGRALLLDLGADGARVLAEQRIDLGGLGVRDLVMDGADLLVLAGPITDAAAAFRLYRVDRSGASERLEVELAASTEGLVLHEESLWYVTDGDGRDGDCAVPSSWGRLPKPDPGTTP